MRLGGNVPCDRVLLFGEIVLAAGTFFGRGSERVRHGLAPNEETRRAIRVVRSVRLVTVGVDAENGLIGIGGRRNI